MKTIVLQRHDFNTASIARAVARLDKQRAEDILYLNDPTEALMYLPAEGPVLLVTGQIFGIRNWYGTELAQAVKRKNPEALVFIYSTEPPEPHPCVDGIIPKSYTESDAELAKLLTSDLTGATAQSIRAAFPAIR